MGSAQRGVERPAVGNALQLVLAALRELDPRPGERSHESGRLSSSLPRGRRAEADEQLQRSLVFWRSVGATRYIRKAEDLLSEASEIPA
jgi:hypothetical protein